MITFRYHIVSIVAVFLALALGVVLGGGPLKGQADEDLAAQAAADRQANTDLRAELTAAGSTRDFTDAFATSVAPRVVADTLAGRAVTLLVLPDADEAAVSSVSELVDVAGGSVAGTVMAGEKLVDVGEKQLVDELGSQLLDGVQDVEVAEGAGTYERLGAILARAVGTTEDAGAPVDDTSSSLLAGLSTADLVLPVGEETRRGSLVLVVGGSSADGSNDEGTSAVVTALVAAIDKATDGVVVAAPVGAGREGGVVAAVRAGADTAGTVSTVDTFDGTAGRVVAIQALAEQAAGQAGHYGSAEAADGAMPGGAAAAAQPEG